MIHENSKISYEENEASGKGASHRQRIIDLLTDTGEEMTDRQIQTWLNVVEKSNIQPEITRMIQSGILVECGKVRCPVTKRPVRTVHISRIGDVL